MVAHTNISSTMALEFNVNGDYELHHLLLNDVIK